MISTERLDLRLPAERDREVFVELFGRSDFMVFSGGTLTPDEASSRFDGMLANARQIPFRLADAVLHRSRNSDEREKLAVARIRRGDEERLLIELRERLCMGAGQSREA